MEPPVTAVTRLHHEEPKQPSRLSLPPQTQPDELALLTMTLSPLQHHYGHVALHPSTWPGAGHQHQPFVVIGIAVALTCSADTIAFFENWEKKSKQRKLFRKLQKFTELWDCPVATALGAPSGFQHRARPKASSTSERVLGARNVEWVTHCPCLPGQGMQRRTRRMGWELTHPYVSSSCPLQCPPLPPPQGRGSLELGGSRGARDFSSPASTLRPRLCATSPAALGKGPGVVQAAAGPASPLPSSQGGLTGVGTVAGVRRWGRTEAVGTSREP